MSKSAETSEFSEQEFNSIRAAVMETDRGRQFLSEFAQRNRVADTQTLLAAIQRLESTLQPQAASASQEDELRELAQAIEATGEDICAVRNDMLKDTCAIDDRQAVFSRLANDAADIATALIITAETIQKSVTELRNSPDGNSHADNLDNNVSQLFEFGWRQDVLAQRISKAMRLLTHLQTNLGTLSGVAVPAVEAQEPAQAIPVPEPATTREPATAAQLTPENKQYFAQDEEIFSAGQPAVEAEQPVEQPAEPSVVVVNTGTEPVASKPAAEPPAQDDSEGPVLMTSPPSAPAEPAASEPKVVVVRAGKPAESADEPEAGAAAPEPAAQTTQIDLGEPEEEDQPGQPEPAAQTPEPAPELAEQALEANTPAEPMAESTSAPQEQPEPQSSEPASDQPSPEPESGAKSNDIMQSFSEFAEAAPSPDATSQPEAPAETEAAAQEKERIVVIRKSSSDKAEIPFADYLGLDDGVETGNQAS